MWVEIYGYLVALNEVLGLLIIFLHKRIKIPGVIFAINRERITMLGTESTIERADGSNGDLFPRLNVRELSGVEDPCDTDKKQ